MISHWIGWLSLILFLLALANIIAKKSRIGMLKKICAGKMHQNWGKLMILFAAIHGVLVTFKFFGGGARHGMRHMVMGGNFWLNWFVGLLCLALAGYIFWTYMSRRDLKQKWLPLHKITAVICAALIAVHIFGL